MGSYARSTGDHVQQLAHSDVDDLGGEVLAVPAADPGEQHLVEAEGLDGPEPVGVIDQSGAVGDDGVVHRVPVAPELDSDLVDTAGVAADLFGDPPAGPVASGPSVHRCAAPRPIHDVVEHADSGHRHRRLCQIRRVARPKQGRSTSSTTGRSFTWANTPQPAHPGLFDRPSMWTRSGSTGHVVDAQDVHFRQAHQQLAHARRVALHRGSPV